jgi:hypothetical protein
MADLDLKPRFSAEPHVPPTKEELAEMSRRHLARIERVREFPVIYDPTDVHVRGEALSEPVLWVGRQWAVTAYGVEARDGTYVIESERLNEGGVGGNFPWECHMAAKDWVDVEDFRTAIMWARGYFATLPKPLPAKPFKAKQTLLQRRGGLRAQCERIIGGLGRQPDTLQGGHSLPAPR